MPELLPIQTSFTGGELSPRMLSRSETAIYGRGAQRMKNIGPVSQGPAFSRNGSVYWDRFTGTKGMVFTFKETYELSYSVVITSNGANNLSVVTNDIRDAISYQIIENNLFTQGLNSWRELALQGEAWVDSEEILNLKTAVNSGDVAVTQFVRPYNPNQTHFLYVQSLNNETLTVKIGKTPNADDIFTISGTDNILAGSFIPGQDFYITLYRAGGDETTKQVNFLSLRPQKASAIVEAFPHPWPFSIELIHAKQPPGLPQMYFTHPDVVPHKLIKTGANWSFQPVVLTGKPPSMDAPPWPRCLAFFQGRLWYGGPYEHFFGSKSGEYDNLTTGNQPSDGLEFELDRRGEIVWMESAKNLLIGTRTAEYIVTSEGGLIIQSDIDVEEQSAYGSAPAQPISLGSKVGYVTADGRKFQDIEYQWTAEKWLSEELTFASEHLTEGAQIAQVVWAQNPNKYIICRLSNGTCIVCVYDPTQEVIGWWRLESDGFIHSISVAEVYGTSIVCLLVERNDPTYLYLETLTELFVLDSSGQQLSTTGTNLITGAVHLANRTVRPVVDGNVHPLVTLDASGNATLDYEGYHIVFGLPVEQEIYTMPKDVIVDAGSISSFVRRFNRVFLRLIDSVKPRIEASESALRAPQTPMDTAEKLVTEDIQVTNLGYNRGEIFVYNDLPIPIRLAGIFGEMTANKV